MHQVDENAKAISLFPQVVQLNDSIEDEGKCVENLIRGILAGNIFDLGSAQVAVSLHVLCSFHWSLIHDC